ncbi:DUF488 domain-containing protein [Aquirufa aurantiipilula]|uniref:DUF488 domain-containing protein n=1 Tax=Aquirufa aurantiipilula TaxID=2696561 RepID=UPI001CAA4F12|nr:DUF488 domain-containing protein [Aquirufa aurantiipilula]MBZ1325625.1 DUF488 domain-containing protein [Aquirufa aurantiipilula]
MFYRRRIILSLLQTFEGELGKTKFQKLLLLFTQQQLKQDFHFVPYRYGCYSFQAAADISTMQKYGQLKIGNNGVKKIDPQDYVSTLKIEDKKIINSIFLQHRNKSYSDLIKFTYQKYPYYAIHSEIANRYLTDLELEAVNNHVPFSNETILFTIGYEGVSLEEYLNKLIKEDVKVLVDVRNNPQSMKYGFTKSQLLNATNSVGIEYIHFPEVGIVSNQRQELNTQEDYDKLFSKYIKETLSQTKNSQEKILELVMTKKRVALTCFEANICQCHRKHLAEAVISLPNWNYKLKHI